MTRATTKATATTTMIEMTDSSMTAILTGDPLVGVLRSQTVPVTLSSSVPSYLVYSFLFMFTQTCAGGGRGSGTQLINS